MTESPNDKGEAGLHWARSEMDRLTEEMGRLTALELAHPDRALRIADCERSLAAAQNTIAKHRPP